MVPEGVSGGVTRDQCGRLVVRPTVLWRRSGNSGLFGVADGCTQGVAVGVGLVYVIAEQVGLMSRQMRWRKW